MSSLALAITVLLLLGGPVASSRLTVPKTLATTVTTRATPPPPVIPVPVTPEPTTLAASQPVPVSTLQPGEGGTAPTAFAPVEATTRAAVSVDLADPTRQPQLADLLASVDGVTHVATIHRARVVLGGVPADLAIVDPDEFRPFTPEATANHRDLWTRVDAGDVVVTHEFGTTHEVPLGSSLAIEPPGDPVRIGAFATNGTPPVADAIVGPTGHALLGDLTSITVLVGLTAEASPEATVNRLTDADFTAVEIPDPRIPNSQTIVPPEGITPENVWDHLAMCESSGDWHINTGNGYYGGIQFLPESWWAVGGEGLPHEHTREEQIYRGTLLWQIQGWEAWPQCARKLGLIVDPPPDPTPTPS